MVWRFCIELIWQKWLIRFNSTNWWPCGRNIIAQKAPVIRAKENLNIFRTISMNNSREPLLAHTRQTDQAQLILIWVKIWNWLTSINQWTNRSFEFNWRSWVKIQGRSRWPFWNIKVMTLHQLNLYLLLPICKVLTSKFFFTDWFHESS